MLSPEALRNLLEDLDLPVAENAISPLLRFVDELLRWNRSINLTAIRDPEEALEKHIADSLTLLPLLVGDERLLDLGSGGGLPGIPLKIARPALKVSSVESIGKKASFQRHAARMFGLEDFEVLQGRAEDLPAGGCAGRYDVVTSRAFASLGDFARLALPFLAPEGRIIAMKGSEGEGELLASGKEMAALGLECQDMRRLRLPVSKSSRVLLVLTRS